MKKFIKGFVVIALASAMAFAVAQGNGQGGSGQGRRGGFGQRMGGMRMGGSLLQLAMRSDVQTELNVTADQKTKLEALRPQRGQGGQGGTRGSGNGGNGGGQRGGNFDPAAMQKAMQERQAKERTDLAAILSADQMKRLDEISLQMQGTNALTQEKTQKDLGLSTDQVAKIKDLQTKQREAMQSVFEKMRNEELTREEAQASMEKNTKAMDEELLKVLTTEQKAKFESMKGKPFKADPNVGFGRRGGGGGGGGN